MIKNKKRQIDIDKENGWKICSACEVKQLLDNFYFHSTRNHYEPKCKKCFTQNKNAVIKRKLAKDIDIENGYKTCITCNITKLIQEFIFDKYDNYFKGQCKKCRNKQEKIRREIRTKNNPEKAKQENHKNYIKYSKSENGRIKIQEGRRKRSKILKYRIKNTLKCRIRTAIKSERKSENTMKLVGCDTLFFQKYIESLWEDKMSWLNYGYGENKWELDHILPCELFDMSDPIQQKWCFNYVNLQPLWHNDNNAKSDSLDNNKMARYLSWQKKLQYLKTKGFDISITHRYSEYIKSNHRFTP